MVRFDWFAREMANQILRVQVPSDAPFDSLFEHIFLKYTSSVELISVDSVQSGTLTELTYSLGLKKSSQIEQFISEIKNLNNNNKVTLIAGYNGTDL
jgi:archaellum biogenesis ATPase FlaH